MTRAYVIENNLSFDPAENTLTSLITEESVTLSLVSSRLLEQLLLSRGQVMTRDEIFSTLFDMWGATSTNNNLNQYILTLRKQLHYLGIEDEVIKTVPRVGFLIPEHIQISVTDELSEDSSIVKKQGRPPKDCMNLYTRHKWSIRYGVLLSIFILAVTTNEMYASSRSLSWHDIPLTPVNTITPSDGCNILSLPGSPPEEFNYYQKALYDMNDMQCNPLKNSRFYFSQQKSPYNKKRTFIMRCEGALFSPSCFSHYYSTEGAQ